ncbi:MAG: 2-amino-4-hydroxy-6-hydroxymethyldihydropteridine diphosphokinase [Verrucomicrobiales bacterium]|nr:2-amino-4-hydroxy-6-hydroxymethyldihydropteridine diphosphokinase [Verrucomicrobiales bacterium]
MKRVGISLGTNLGDRSANLKEAISRLRNLAESDHWLVSGVYETAPVDCAEGDPLFLNCVVEFESNLAPVTLLQKTQTIESDLGRPKERGINAPRTIDLDILYVGETTIETPTLTLPHPRMMERDFVMIPLKEIRADLVGGISGNQNVRKLDSQSLP